jgi:hypothetical protein
VTETTVVVLAGHKHSAEAGPAQLTIFTPVSTDVIRAIENADLDNLKPIGALNLLTELKEQIE